MNIGLEDAILWVLKRMDVKEKNDA